MIKEYAKLYWDMYVRIISDKTRTFKNDIQAWEVLEEQWEKEYKIPRYLEYNTFKIAKYRWFKQNR